MRLLRDSLGDWMVIAACWWTMAHWPNAWVYGLGVVLIAGRLHALGVVLHDACHLPPRNKAAALWLVEALAGWTIGSTIAAMRYHHLRHHRASCMVEDPYLHRLAARGFWMRRVLMLRGALVAIWWPLRAVCAPLALAWPAFRTPYARGFLQDRSGRDLRADPDVLECARADLAQLSAHLLLGTAIVYWQLPFFAYYFVPWVLGGVFNANRVLVEHEHVEIDSRSPARVWSTTYTHDVGLIGKLALFPRNIGFHQAHHAYPAVAQEHLPELHRRLVKMGAGT